MSIHTETAAGACAACGTAWPCAEWVADREDFDAETGGTCDSCGRWLIRHPWSWCKKRSGHSCTGSGVES